MKFSFTIIRNISIEKMVYYKIEDEFMNYCLNDEEVILFKEIAESNDFFEGDEVTVIVTNFNLILFKEVKKFLRKPEYFEEVVPIRTIKYYR